MKDFKGNELKIGDKVVFCVHANMLAEGAIINFYRYKDCLDEDMWCAIQTATSKVIHIHSSSVFKLEE